MSTSETYEWSRDRIFFRLSIVGVPRGRSFQRTIASGGLAARFEPARGLADGRDFGVESSSEQIELHFNERSETPWGDSDVLGRLLDREEALAHPRRGRLPETGRVHRPAE
jgi:hypothetical protein